MSGSSRNYDRSYGWGGSLNNERDYRGMGSRRGYYGAWADDVNYGGRDYGWDFDRGNSAWGYPQRGDSGESYDRGYGAREGGGYRARDYDRDRYDAGDDYDYGGRAYELTFERGYGAYDAVQRQRRNQRRRQAREGSPDPYRHDQDRTQEWLLRDYPWGRGRDWLPPGGPHAGKGPQGYRRSDERIREDANERLTRHGRLDARNITVEVDDGEITLVGTVPSRRDKRMAEDAIESITGVQDVHNDLRIQQPATP